MIKPQQTISEKKTDYTFIASMILITVFAVYLFMDRFSTDAIGDYLKNTGEELFARISDSQKREMLEKNYAEILERVNNQQVDPERVEFLTSSLINLKVMQEGMKPEDVEIVVQTLLDSLSKDSDYTHNDQQWQALNTRVKQIKSFEEQLRAQPLSDADPQARGEFVYAVDDSLNIVLNEDLKKRILTNEKNDKMPELEFLEKMKFVKWEKNLAKELLKNKQKLDLRIEAITATTDSLRTQSQISINIPKLVTKAQMMADSLEVLIIQSGTPPAPPSPTENRKE